ncbi:MAG: alpha/beta hydrolase [Clostridiales Family XIII bacterium]|jgi:pimeloyl-ACP methyl ester carboxylesterase|nr:alpha/beta hydrolase [Clostridiales Family XIII bacterium]
MIAVICISLAALVAALAVVLLVLSPGTMPAPAGKDGISEKVFVEIGGVRQGMFLRGADTGNPVLLYVHGGPGMPTYFLAEKTAAPLEESFTVCYWEQRGAGLSWSADMDPSAITTEQLVDDTIEVAAYLSERFGQEKVLLVGHSWGSYIAIQAAEKAPERFSAYVGIAQVSDTARAGEIAWQYLIDRYEEEGNEKRLAALRALPAVTTDEGAYAFFNAPIRETAQHELGVGSTHEMRSVVTGIFFPQLACRAYTLPEKVAFWRAKAFLRKETKLGDEVFAANLFEEVPRLEVPAYFMSGAYDYTVPWELSQEYLEALEAPDKGFYLFEDSAHSPIFEEPERFAEVLQEVAKP